MQSKSDVGFVAANGSRMKNYGSTEIKFNNQGKAMCMNFHITDVHKPLASVTRIVEAGNRVVFGPEEFYRKY